jgi:EpsI family protein
MSIKFFVIAASALIMTTILVGVLSRRPEPVVVRTKLEKLPMEIAGYKGTEDTFPESVYRELNADKNVYRHYCSTDGDQIDLYIGYYGTAKGGRTGHNPYACLPGAGWAIVDSHKLGIRMSSTSQDVAVNYIHARKDGINTVLVHWYQSGGTKVMSSGISQNIERFLGRLLHNRNDGAFVQISTLVPEHNVADARIKIKNFAGQVLCLIPLYWPEEK